MEQTLDRRVLAVLTRDSHHNDDPSYIRDAAASTGLSVGGGVDFGSRDRNPSRQTNSDAEFTNEEKYVATRGFTRRVSDVAIGLGLAIGLGFRVG